MARMTDKTFVEMVHQHFGFLINEFQYKVNQEYQSQDQYDSGFVEFTSSTVVLQVKKDGQNLLVSIMPRGEPEVSREYLPTISEALSVFKAEECPVIVAPHEYEKALNLYASLLKENLKNLLVGDFSQWLEILRFKIEDRKKDYFSWTGKKLPPNTFRQLEEYIRSKKTQGHYT